MQKAAYFIQEFGKLDLGYEFVIYQYGPYSFQLDSDIADLVAVGALRAQLVSGYPDYVLGDNADSFEERLSAGETIEKTERAVDAVAGEIATRVAKELELVSTTAYVREAYPGISGDDLVKKVRSLKPHFSDEDIRSGISTLDDLIGQIRRIVEQ